MNQISTAADFPNVIVSTDTGGGRRVSIIAFKNPELGNRALAGIAAWSLVFVAVWMIFGVEGAWPLGLVTFVGALWVGTRLAAPWKIPRTIELDYGSDQLRVKKRGRVEMVRQLSRLVNLTVEDHPDAVLSREKRGESGERKMPWKEKQHCLFGWFGAAGAEKAMLLARAEWPPQNSLFEVRQAIMWAIDHAPPPREPEPSRPPEPAPRRPVSPTRAKPVPEAPERRRGGINPPLD